MVESYVSSLDTSVYSRFTKKIIESLSKDQIVSFVSYGHPLYLVNTSQEIIQYANANNVDLEVIAGISSLDLIWNIIGEDPGGRGMQVLEAAHMIEGNIQLVKEIDLYIAHATEYKIPFERSEKVSDNPEGIKEIKKTLTSNGYKESYIVHFIACSPIPTLDDVVMSVSISEMDSHECLLKYMRGMTLFVPNKECANNFELKKLNKKTINKSLNSEA